MPNIKNVEIEIVAPTIRMMGIIHWELRRKGIIIKEGSFRNLITDAGLDGMNNTKTSTLTTYVAVGTGSSVPANNQTSLDAEIGRVNRRTTGDQTITSGPAFAYWSVKWVYLFLEAEANGNLTEVGFFQLNAAGTMFARQRFKDGLGNPTTVVKTAADQLQITYELRAYSPTVDATQVGLVISGTSYNITTRARIIGSAVTWGWDGVGTGFLGAAGFWAFTTPGGRAFDSTTALGPTTGGLSGTSAPASTSVAAAYVNGTFYRDVTMKWEPTDGNLVGGIGGIHSYGGQTTEMFQSVFTPVFAKDATKRLTLVVRCAWARYP